MGAFTSIGVMINGAPAFDLGSNESWIIDLPPQAIQQFKFVIPRDKSFDLRIPSSLYFKVVSAAVQRNRDVALIK